MKTWQQLMEKRTVRLLNHHERFPDHHHINQAIASFAIEDAIATAVGEKLVPTTIRFWIHDQTIVLGIPDSRLPFIHEGIDVIKAKGFYPIIRNSGGLAVGLDKGVLNLSLIFPNDKMPSIHGSYDTMYAFIKDVLAPYTTNVEAYEIAGSFCPGDYDLSIGGIKFAGISQRRVRQGISVQIYLDVCGNSLRRSNIVKQFYDVSKKNKQTRYDYPTINPDVMRSLSELLDREITVEDIVERIKTMLQHENIKMEETDLTDYELETYQKRLKQMVERNKLIHD